MDVRSNGARKRKFPNSVQGRTNNDHLRAMSRAASELVESSADTSAGRNALYASKTLLQEANKAVFFAQLAYDRASTAVEDLLLNYAEHPSFTVLNEARLKKLAEAKAALEAAQNKAKDAEGSMACLSGSGKKVASPNIAATSTADM